MAAEADLRMYMIDGMQMPWLEAFDESVHKHIFYVRQAGEKIGVPSDQLEIHDLSKFTIQEFPHYARSFHGDRADPDGFAGAWLHHLHNNPHHWQFWMFPDGFTPKGSKTENGVMEMPSCFALEMIADWMGASYTYTGSWDMTEWLSKNVPKITLHSNTAEYVQQTLNMLGYTEWSNEFARVA